MGVLSCSSLLNRFCFNQYSILVATSLFPANFSLKDGGLWTVTTSTIYSTSYVVITSCASMVSYCPGRSTIGLTLVDMTTYSTLLEVATTAANEALVVGEPAAFAFLESTSYCTRYMTVMNCPGGVTTACPTITAAAIATASSVSIPIDSNGIITARSATFADFKGTGNMVMSAFKSCKIPKVRPHLRRVIWVFIRYGFSADRSLLALSL